MKKVRILVVVLTMALMLMGVGYATWNQSMPINVSGSLARFNVDAVEAKAIFPADVDRATVAKLAETTSATVVSNKEIALIANKLYPGQSRQYAITFRNTGEIGAVLTKIALQRIDNGAALDQLIITVNGQERTMNSNHTIDLNQDIPVGQSATVTIKLLLNGDAPDSLNDLSYRIFALRITPTFNQK